MKKNLIWIVLALVVVAAGVYWYQQKGSAVEEDNVVRIGAILPLTGSAAVYGIPAKQGIELAAKQLKNEYNSDIQLYFEDSKGDAKTAVSSFRKLVSNDKIDFVVGDLLSSTTLAIAPLANSEKKFLISPTASASELNDFGYFSFSIYPSELEEGKAAAELAQKLSYKKIGLIYENVPASLGMVKGFEANFGSVEFKESIESNQSDFKNIASKIKQIEVDAVYLITYGEPAKKIVKTLCEYNIATNIISQSALYDGSLAEYLHSQKCIKAFHLTGAYFNEQRNDIETTKFKSAFLEEFNTSPNMFSAQSYDALKIGFQLNKNKISKSDFQQYTFSGVAGEFSGDVNKRKGFAYYKLSAEGDFTLFEIK